MKIDVNIFWDMDGTLFAFIYGGDIYSRGYFENLPAHKSLIEAAEKLDGLTLNNGVTFHSYILSSYLTDSPYDPRAEKNRALDRETLGFPKEKRIFLPCGSSKWDAVMKLGLDDNAILIDDFGQNIRCWKGQYVKVSKDAEDMLNEMQRHKYCISPDSDVATVIKTVCSAASAIAL